VRMRSILLCGWGAGRSGGVGVKFRKVCGDVFGESGGAITFMAVQCNCSRVSVRWGVWVCECVCRFKHSSYRL